MKRFRPLFLLLVIFLVSISCDNFLDFLSYFEDIDWDKIEVFVEDQYCETLDLELQGGNNSHVYVDDIKFSCNVLEEGYFCSGPSSSINPELTVTIYEYGDRTNLKRTIIIPSERPWDKCDFDKDGVNDAKDGCPDDPDKTDPGFCGCWEDELDSDGDEIPDCADDCPGNSEKDSPGRCGCELSDTDTDQDNMPDCLDDCPDDPSKEAPESCGCGVAEVDSDGDFIPDCVDGCPEDPGKEAPETCGCGIAETDTDGDAVADCVDDCPDDSEKESPGICGCGIAEVDSDGDDVKDCIDKCPDDAWHDLVGDPCDHDEDDDGTHDGVDECPFNPLKTRRDKCGCKNSCGDPVLPH